MGDFFLVILGQLTGDQRLFIVVEPAGLMHAILEIAQHQQSNHDCRYGLQHEHPLPSGPAVHTCEVGHDPAGEGAAHHA
ncbi:hypothetical protein D3C75_1192700 [compost metagenome]